MTRAGVIDIVIVIVISKLLKRYLKAKRTRAPAYSRALRRIKGAFQRGVKRSSGLISRIPGGDRVAAKVGVVQVGSVNDQIKSTDLQACCRSFMEENERRTTRTYAGGTGK